MAKTAKTATTPKAKARKRPKTVAISNYAEPLSAASMLATLKRVHAKGNWLQSMKDAGIYTEDGQLAPLYTRGMRPKPKKKSAKAGK